MNKFTKAVGMSKKNPHPDDCLFYGQLLPSLNYNSALLELVVNTHTEHLVAA